VGRPKSLTKRLVVTFCLLALAAVAVNAKFIADVSWEMTSTKASVGLHVKDQESHVVAEEPAASYAYRNRMIILLGMMVICFGSIIYLFVSRVVVPLNAIEQAAKEISRGNLAVTFPRNPSGEIGALGEVMNDLAANLQEILLLTGTSAGNSLSEVETIEQVLTEGDAPCVQEIQERIRSIRKDLEMLSSLATDFEFYQTSFDGRKVVPKAPGDKT